MIRMTTRRRALVTGAAAALLWPVAGVAAAPVRVAVDASGTAIDGYDSHAYWRHGAPRVGQTAHVVDWAGVPWRFETAQDAAAFAATPDAFAPKFGGFCTRAMSFRKIVNADPEVWRIFEGGLYLFAKPVGGTKFDAGPRAMIAKAQSHWDTL
ncbi:YHS domain-containing (seleno)protein [Sulfitobacter sp. S190]|uniref:YHS domain-containing (seleno)protein n=1 Tax=Sulfitobacter sp. S190 TaxID=2867022 RepID=UPI0021A6A1BB|nr:YHS domain-containing (seleno)protein [Sulfitobacter sp. S190]UWR21482.1 twin-arginine translocation pathway signal protein [Sulfitobacter sp. S190]